MKVIHSDGSISVCEGADELQVLRHSAAHILAQAIHRLYPDASFAYGSAMEKGFYYDIDPAAARFQRKTSPPSKRKCGRS